MEQKTVPYNKREYERQRSRDEMRRDIMSIQDREERIRAIAKNRELFTGKKEG